MGARFLPAGAAGRATTLRIAVLVALLAAAFRFGGVPFGFAALTVGLAALARAGFDARPLGDLEALALAFTAFLAVFFAALALGAARFRLAVFLAAARPRPAAFRAPAFLPAFDELRREARTAFRLAMDVLSLDHPATLTVSGK